MTDQTNWWRTFFRVGIHRGDTGGGVRVDSGHEHTGIDPRKVGFRPTVGSTTSPTEL